MKKIIIMKQILLIIFSIVLLSSQCDLENVTSGLTDEEIIEGLKTALVVGTDSSSTALSLANGYYGDALVKIPLPEEAQKIQNDINAILSLAPSLSSYLNLDQHFENVVKSVNHAAEESAKEAAPIFKDAITGLSITQGWEILKGNVPEDETKAAGFDSTAATQYLSGKTFTSLTNLYAPKIDLALDKDLGLGFSANQAWTTLRTAYNNSVESITGNIVTNLALQTTGYKLEPLETESIGVFATEKALDGLFFKVGETEKKIRRDPWAWVTTTVGDILTKVFGS
jgi:hypothetical protein